MDPIPADLLEIKNKLDSWRATRKYHCEPLPDDLRRDAAAVSRRYPYSLIRKILRVDPRRLLGPQAKTSSVVHEKKKSQTAFFKLPPAGLASQEAAVSAHNSCCRVQLERSDGSRLTLTLTSLDAASLNSLCRDFLKG